jgi:small-conductance mechanosensitive channel
MEAVGNSYLSAGLLAFTLLGVFLIRARSTPIKIACELGLLAAIAAYLMYEGTSPLPGLTVLAQRADGVWLRALAVVWWLIAARVVAIGAVIALGRDVRSRQARLFSDLLAGAIYLTAALIVLNLVLDLPIQGLLATSGVIAIVLGLALQNTLSDVFSGIAFGLEQPFHVGDRITISDHAEGIVVEMNWRSIRVQTDGEDVAIIPNSIVARSQIINRSVPTERRAASVEIPTLSSARSEHLMDLISQAILLCPGILEHPVPSISIKHVGTRITTLGVTYFVATTPAMSAAKSQLLRQVRRLFRHAGVQDGEPVSTEGVLKSLILFESLSAAQLESLASAVIERRLETGGHVFEQGTLGASLYIMRAGVFEVVRQREDGQPIVYGRIGPGEYLGEISMMTGEPRPVTVTALTAGIVHELPRTAIEALLGKDKALSAALEQSVQRGLALLDRDDAARACQPLDAGGSLLGRIRNFLHLQPAP